MSDEILDSLQIDNSSNGGSFTETYDSVTINGPTFPDEGETVSVAAGFDVRRGYRKTPEARILVPDAFAGTGSNDSIIDDVMEPRHDAVLTYNWNGGNSTVLSGAKVLAQPIMDAMPDSVAVWYDTDTATDDNPDTDADSSWTKLGEVVANNEHGSENITNENGRGQPYWKYSRFMHQIPVDYTDAAYSNIKTEENAQAGGNTVDVAIENQAGNYRIYNSVYVRAHQMPSPGPDSEVHHFILSCYQAGSFTDIISYPTGAEDYFYGVSITANAWGHEEGDILTENRT